MRIVREKIVVELLCQVREERRTGAETGGRKTRAMTNRFEAKAFG